ncbi:hypothetical protein A0H81_01604 [Grifola frondosa]|uniref:Uncharacterized protein n=1 Tax=Grifola frondosa TaxID=5627 RepID=A0A1C7MNI9_GRIFR|nr:hypothetical protein A0H81_01604 [Grifola frondosa]
MSSSPTSPVPPPLPSLTVNGMRLQPPPSFPAGLPHILTIVTEPSKLRGPTALDERANEGPPHRGAQLLCGAGDSRRARASDRVPQGELMKAFNSHTC